MGVRPQAVLIRSAVGYDTKRKEKGQQIDAPFYNYCIIHARQGHVSQSVNHYSLLYPVKIALPKTSSRSACVCAIATVNQLVEAYEMLHTVNKRRPIH